MLIKLVGYKMAEVVELFWLDGSIDDDRLMMEHTTAENKKLNPDISRHPPFYSRSTTTKTQTGFDWSKKHYTQQHNG